MKWRQVGKFLVVIGIGWFVLFLCLIALFRPSHDRDWELGHEQLPRIEYSATSSIVMIENYRDFAWTAAKVADVHYSTRVFDLEKLEGVDVFISHFDEFEGLAHIFLSFGFLGGEQVVVSLETRREKHEEFSPLLGLLRQFEIIYVVGSERDIVGVRTGYRGERVYLYPTVATKEQARELFDQLAGKINEVNEQPRMYNTLTHNCTNELTRPVEQISGIDFPLTWKTLLPGYFDEVLYELGLIERSAPFVVVKESHRLDNQSLTITSESYSSVMREQVGIKNK